MKKVYLEYPYINSLNTKVIHQKIINGEYHFELEQTIFFPGTEKIKSDEGWINQKKIIRIYEENNKVYHVLKENLSGSVQLDLDWNKRLQRMQDHSSLLILKHYLKEIYNLEVQDYKINNQCYLSVSNKEGYNLDNMVNRLNTLTNNYILSSLPIKSYFEESTRKEEGKTYQIRKHFIKFVNLNNYPCQDTLIQNSSEIRGFYINNAAIHEDKIVFEYICGNQLFDQWARIVNEVRKDASSNPNLVNKFLNENSKLTEENTLLKSCLIDSILKDSDSNCTEIDLSNLPLIPEDFMLHNPKKNVFAYLKGKDHIYFYTNDPSHITRQFPNKTMIILSNEYDSIYGILRDK